MDDIPPLYPIRESSHRVLNPITPEQLAMLGAALRLEPGWRLLDLACGKGELLCTWARDHAITGTGVDLSAVFHVAARERAVELGVADRVKFIHADAAGFAADGAFDVTSCLGATWIGDGLAGTLELLERALRPGGLVLVGEPYWRHEPPPGASRAIFGVDDAAYLPLPDLVEQFHALGWDVVEMVAADEYGWDRYVAASWLNLRRWLDAHPGHELAGEIRAELTASQLTHTRYQREYLGWAVFALLRR
jgi:SAM-dependent methyltransferase